MAITTVSLFWLLMGINCLHANCRYAVLPDNKGIPRQRVTAILVGRKRWQ